MQKEMTVGFLTEKLKDFSPETPVKFMIDSGAKDSYLTSMKDANGEKIAIIVVGVGLY
jgi:hypothetical protein